MNIILRDRSAEVVAAATAAGLTAELGSILVRADAVVSPANSFGFMDGGVDYAYSQFFGWGLQDRVQSEIARLPFGELLVGQAIVVPTGDQLIPNLIVAPTMRVPKVITDPADIMLATRAAVNAAKQAGLQTIAFPGMGTGCGQVNPRVAVTAMMAGFSLGRLPQIARSSTWREAQYRHFRLEG